MNVKNIKLKEITLSVAYTMTACDPEVGMEAEIEISSIKHEEVEMFNFCEYFNILPEIYPLVWDKL